jgi:hypothetical protein
VAHAQAPSGRERVRRFWEKVDRRGPTDCWEWKASRDSQGYGQFRVGCQATAKRFLWKAHRFSALLAGWNVVGRPELVVMHSSDHPPCVNPAHLSLGTRAENARARFA